VGQPTASPVNSAIPIAIAPTLTRTPRSAPAPIAITTSAGRATTGIATGMSAARQPASDDHRRPALRDSAPLA
jgi:hypothetical protein